MKSRNEESVEEQPESDQPDYADITHILKAGETTYENVAFQSEKDTYANVVALQWYFYKLTLLRLLCSILLYIHNDMGLI